MLDAFASHRWITVVLMSLCALAGCHTGGREEPRSQVAIDAREYDRMFEAAVTELREAGFAIERRDYRFGRITTEPRDVPTVFEPWQRAAGAEPFAAEATLGHLRQRVAVLIDPVAVEPAGEAGAEQASQAEQASASEPPSRYRLLVEVVVERAQKPTQRLSGTATSRVFAPLEVTPANWRARGIEDTYWEPIGRDETLETRLLRLIVERASRPTPRARASMP
ncbi:MAG: hypothetical protein ACOC1G_00230 [Phycisphaeraceae bacterium]